MPSQEKEKDPYTVEKDFLRVIGAWFSKNGIETYRAVILVDWDNAVVDIEANVLVRTADGETEEQLQKFKLVPADVELPEYFTYNPGDTETCPLCKCEIRGAEIAKAKLTSVFPYCCEACKSIAAYRKT